MMFKKFLAGIIPLLSLANAGSLEALLSTHPKLSTLKGLLAQFDLLEDFNSYKDITVIAPTNQAYLDLAHWGFNVSEVPAAVARALLTYHVLQGVHPHRSLNSHPEVIHTHLKPPVLTNVSDGAAVKLSQHAGTVLTQSGLGVYGGVEEADIKFDNGVLHTLNASMVLPHNITLTAEINGLTKFLHLMSKADLVEELEALRDATVFIPSNEALQNLVWLMKKLPKTELSSILKSHVVPNRVLYGEVLKDGEVLETLQGGKIRVKKDRAGKLYVNGVRLVNSDVILYGGVAHVVEDVLVPTAEDEEHRAGKVVYERLGYQIPLI